MDEHFDAVIIGSGFGGSVCAYRLAQANRKVCLLERGNRYPPGAFPRTRNQMSRNFWDPSEGYYGLFNLWSFRGLEAVVASGLGGGSLIYANVLLRMPESWFVKGQTYQGVHEHWPISYADLKKHYEQVEAVLKPQKYPYATTTKKTAEMKEAAEALGLAWKLPPLAITFANGDEAPCPGVPISATAYNLHHRSRATCSLCGECDIGCNFGSKNTMDHTYLSLAEAMGAQIRHLHEVRTFAPLPDHTGYEIFYVKHDLTHEGKKLNTKQLPQQRMTAKRLILCAGALGTTYLLLKNRSAFPQLSPKLGENFCGNGDLLSFAVNATADGDAAVPRKLDPTHGPVITSTICVEDTVSGGQGRGYLIQDAGFPAFITWSLEAANFPRLFLRVLRFLLFRMRQWMKRYIDSDLSAEVATVFDDSHLFTNSLPLLGMGRDVADGVMRLRRGFLDIDWNTKSSSQYIAQVWKTMRTLANHWNARFVQNPTFRLKRVVTVHPLGGCPMGSSAADGVVDVYGEVFHYPRLYIADGAVMPGAVGVNPALTIAAFADRCAEHMLAQLAEEEQHEKKPVATQAKKKAGSKKLGGKKDGN